MSDELWDAIDEFNEGTITLDALKDAGIDPALLMCFPADWEGTGLDILLADFLDEQDAMLVGLKIMPSVMHRHLLESLQNGEIKHVE